MVLEVMAYSGSSLGATLTALSAVAGDSLTIRNFAGSAGILQLWGNSAMTGSEIGAVRVFSPEMHDTINGVRASFWGDFDRPQGTSGSQTGCSDPLLPDEFVQPLNPQQALTIQAQGDSATPTGIGMLVWYDQLLGTQQRLITPEEVKQKMVNLAGIEVTLSAGVSYSTTSAAINATNDQLRANTDYAILGYTVEADATVIGIKGPDTGFIHVGGPGILGRNNVTRNWFVKLSRLYGRPCIPVFNSANKATTLVEAQSNVSTTHKVTLLVAQLGSAASA